MHTTPGVRLAALALLSAATFTACGGDDRKAGSDDPSGTPSQTPGSSGSPSTSAPAAKPGPLGLGDHEQGEAPRNGWAEGTKLHLPGGGTMDVGRAFDQVTFGGSRLVGLSHTDGAGEVVGYDYGSTTPFGRWKSLGGFVTDDLGTVGWIAPDGSAMALAPNAKEPIVVTRFDAGTMPVAVQGDCVSATSSPACTMFGNFEDAGSSVFLVGSTGGAKADKASSTVMFGQDAHRTKEGGDLLVGITKLSDEGSCSALVGPQADSATWSTCEFMPEQFSADGEHLIAHDDYRDGIGDGRLAILDAATGKALVDLTNTDSQAFLNNAVWEDQEHVLATVFQDGRWAVLRVGVDGSVEYAVAPRPGQDVEPPFTLAG